MSTESNINIDTEEYVTLGEEWCIANADSIDWYEFRFPIGIFSKDFEVMFSDEIKRWINEEGYYHRLDGPAYIYECGNTIWMNNGYYHREGGPALEYENGSKEWYLNGKRHREDGPAIECCDGVPEWYIHGKRLTEKEFYNS